MCVCVCARTIRANAEAAGSCKTTEEMDWNSSKSEASDPYRYKMDYPCIGTCVVINNKNFHQKTGNSGSIQSFRWTEWLDAFHDHCLSLKLPRHSARSVSDFPNFTNFPNFISCATSCLTLHFTLWHENDLIQSFSFLTYHSRKSKQAHNMDMILNKT